MASKKAIYAEDLLLAIRDDPEIDGKHFARIKEHISNAQVVDGATPAKPPLIQAKRAIESRYVQSLGVEHSVYEDVLRLIESIENHE